MRIDRDTLVFFDASCLIAAAGSPSGGSGFLLSLCQKGLLRACVSHPVLLEAERNILSKLDNSAYIQYRRLLGTIPMIIVLVPRDHSRYRELVGEKDEHVIAAAIQADAGFLLTLDKNLAARINHGHLGVRALSPGEFIKSVLVDHPDYRNMRD